MKENNGYLMQDFLYFCYQPRSRLEINHMFRSYFFATIQSFTQDSAIRSNLWSDIAARYAEERRFYHNMHHLDTLAADLEEVRTKVKDWHVLMLATAYHDIIYDTNRTDNEEASAAYAVSMLSKALPADLIMKCSDLILATKAHQLSEDADTNYFTDADLSILGKPASIYQRYSQQIRSEYSQFPDTVYKAGRAGVLKHILSMKRIFKTDEFFGQYEKPARGNITEELFILEHQAGTTT